MLNQSEPTRSQLSRRLSLASSRSEHFSRSGVAIVWKCRHHPGCPWESLGWLVKRGSHKRIRRLMLGIVVEAKLELDWAVDNQSQRRRVATARLFVSNCFLCSRQEKRRSGPESSVVVPCLWFTMPHLLPTALTATSTCTTTHPRSKQPPSSPRASSWLRRGTSIGPLEHEPGS